MRWRYDSHFMEALYVVFIAFCLVILSSCAHDPAMSKKIAAETSTLPVLNANARADAAEKTFENASLSPKQKSALEEIALSANSEMQALREENAKLRLLLVRQLVNPQASDREIDAIKLRILETDRASSKRWLSALDEARHVLGRKNEEDRKFYSAFMREPLTPEDTGSGRSEK